MKPGFVCAFCVALTLTACGSDTSSDSDTSQVTAASQVKASASAPEASNVAVKVVNANSSEKMANAKLTEPDVQFPSGPPPKEIIIKDLREGSGPPAQEGDEMTIKFFCIGEDGTVLYTSWDKEGQPTATFELGADIYFPGWDDGVAGMKAGGRREIIFPQRLIKKKLSGTREPVLYVVDLISIQ
jgi:peptidylprolyl isomerase